jgi:predicted nucleic acid-binding protein
MARYLPDTNHLTYLLQRHRPTLAAYEDAIRNGDELLLSAVAFYEIIRGIRETHPDRATQSRVEASLRTLTRHWRRAPIGVQAARNASMVWVQRRGSGAAGA